MYKNKKKTAIAAMLAAICVLAAACGSSTKPAAAPAEASSSSSGGASSSAQAASATKVKQILAWFSQPEDGGLYAAIDQGFYQAAGLEVAIEPGSPQVSSIQMVASGKADFGLASGDKLMTARSEGLPVVALFAHFQRSPLVFISHKEQAVTDFSQLNGRTVFSTPGHTYWEYIKKKYNLDNVKELAYIGDMSAFLTDKSSIVQSYLTNEPFVLQKQGIPAEVMRISDSGFMPYDNVLFTTEKFLKENPDVVKAYVEATVKGWEYYEQNYKDVNKFILESNPNGTQEGFDYASEQQRELMYGFEAADKGFGYMSKERWEELLKQMSDLGIVKPDLDLDSFFTTDYIPKK